MKIKNFAFASPETLSLELTNNVLCNFKTCTVTEDDRPLFIYCEDSDDIAHAPENVSTLNRQVFVSITSSKAVAYNNNIQKVLVG